MNMDSFTCEICGKSFSTNKALTGHSGNAHREYVCDLCGDHVVGSSKFRYHAQSHDQSDHSEMCGLCGKVYGSHRALKMHMHFHDPDYKRRHEEYTNSPEAIRARAKRTSDRLRRLWNDDDYREKMSDMARRNWKTPEYRNSVISSMKKTLSEPEQKKRISDSVKRRYADPEKRREQSKRMTEVCARPEVRERMKAGRERRWTRPDEHLKRSEATKRMWEDPEIREKITGGVQRFYRSDDGRALMSRISRNSWSDPRYREKIVSSVQDRWNDDEFHRQMAENFSKRAMDRRLKRISSSPELISIISDESEFRRLLSDKFVEDVCSEFGVPGQENTIRWFADKRGIPVKRRHTSAESKWLNLLNSGGILEIAEQSTIYGDNQRRCDFSIDNVGIEINPSYTHLSIGDSIYQTKPTDYHYRRSRDAEVNGYEIVHVWDWLDEQKVISFLRSKLHMDEHRIGAHKCDLVRISNVDAKAFCDEFHLQNGLSRGQRFRYGLAYDGQLVAVSTYGPNRFSKKDAKWEWLRYCCRDGWHIYGAAQRMQNAFTDDCGEPFVTYTDYSRSNGGMDEAMGMRFLRYTGPTLVWWNGERAVRDTLLLRLGADRVLGTDYGPREVCGMDNHDIMVNEGFVGVYDCGSKVYICG